MQRIKKPAGPAVNGRVCAIPAVPAEKRRLAVAAYCRVSTGDPSQESSIENQRAHYKRCIESNPDWKLAGIYCEAGVSGTAAETRPELQRLIADCRAGRIDMVITKSISRFSRNTVDCLTLERLLSSMGVTLVFEKEDLRTDLMSSELFLTVFAAFSQEESRSLSGNMKWAIRKRFRDGSFKGAKAPYGYRKTGEGRYETEPGEAAVVRRIFAGLAEGRSSAVIAGELNAAGIPTWSAAHGYGDTLWSGGRIRQIARNRFYVGDMLCQKTYRDESYRQRPNRGELDSYLLENAHPAIIDRETFAKADASIRRNAAKFGLEKAGKKRTNRYCFSGRLYCGVCGEKLVRGGGERPFYLCQKHARTGDCPMKPVPERDIRSAFATLLNRLVFASRAGLLSRFSEAENASELRRIHAALAENQRRWGAVYALILTEAPTPSLLEERAALEREARELEARGKRICALDGGKALLESALRRGVRSSAWEGGGDDEIFRSFVEKACVRKGESIEFRFACGLCLRESLRCMPEARELPVQTRFRIPPAGETAFSPESGAEELLMSLRPLPPEQDGSQRG